MGIGAMVVRRLSDEQEFPTPSSAVQRPAIRFVDWSNESGHLSLAIRRWSRPKAALIDSSGSRIQSTSVTIDKKFLRAADMAGNGAKC